LADFQRWQAITGGTIEQYRILLKVGQDRIDLDQRQEAATIALGAQQMEAADGAFTLRSGLVAIAEAAVQAGTTIPVQVDKIFTGILDNAKSTLDQILNAPTREGTQLQLKIDTLTRQADLLKMGCADASRLANVGKSGTAQPTAADRQLDALNKQIAALQEEQKIRADNLAIMKDQAILADQRLQTDADLANKDKWLAAVITNLSTTVIGLDVAMGGLMGTITGGSIPKLASGLSYVPQPMLAHLDIGERVLTASENRQLGAGMPAVTFAQQFTINGSPDEATVDRLMQKIEQANTRSLNRWRGGVMGSTGTN